MFLARRFGVLALWLACCLLSVANALAADDVAVADIGNRLELFVDKQRIETLRDVRLVLHEPRRMETVLELNDPWDGKYAGYFTVFKDGDRFRMYYRGWDDVADAPQVACYAESSDGLRFTKPKLGLFDFKGSKQNNIVLMGPPKEGTHNFTPFKDTRPGVASDEQYKALGGGPLFAYASGDGLRCAS